MAVGYTGSFIKDFLCPLCLRNKHARRLIFDLSEKMAAVFHEGARQQPVSFAGGISMHRAVDNVGRGRCRAERCADACAIEGRVLLFKSFKPFKISPGRGVGFGG